MRMRRLPLVCLLISIGYAVLFFILMALSITTWEDEVGLDPGSPRHQFGVWLGSEALGFLLIPYMPYVFLREVLSIPFGWWDALFMPLSMFLMLWGICEVCKRVYRVHPKA